MNPLASRVCHFLAFADYILYRIFAKNNLKELCAMTNTMKFRIDSNGTLNMVSTDIFKEFRKVSPITSSYSYIPPKIEQKPTNRRKGVTAMSFALPVAIGVATSITGTGVFWNAFMQYIFPYLMDVAKVYCVIKISQGFYEEKRGGRDGGSGMQSFVTYGKWYILFMLVPWGVELIDQLGGKMLTDLRVNPMTTP